MLTSNTKSLENHVVSPEEEEKRLHWEGLQKKGFTIGMISTDKRSISMDNR